MDRVFIKYCDLNVVIFRNSASSSAEQMIYLPSGGPNLRVFNEHHVPQPIFTRLKLTITTVTSILLQGRQLSFAKEEIPTNLDR